MGCVLQVLTHFLPWPPHSWNPGESAASPGPAWAAAGHWRVWALEVTERLAVGAGAFTTVSLTIVLRVMQAQGVGQPLAAGIWESASGWVPASCVGAGRWGNADCSRAQRAPPSSLWEPAAVSHVGSSHKWDWAPAVCQVAAGWALVLKWELNHVGSRPALSLWVPRDNERLTMWNGSSFGGLKVRLPWAEQCPQASQCPQPSSTPPLAL